MENYVIVSYAERRCTVKTFDRWQQSVCYMILGYSNVTMETRGERIHLYFAFLH